MTGFSRHLTGNFQVQSLWEQYGQQYDGGDDGWQRSYEPRGTGHLFVAGKNPVLTGKHAQMTGFARHLTGKILVQSLWERERSFYDDGGK